GGGVAVEEALEVADARLGLLPEAGALEAALRPLDALQAVEDGVEVGGLLDGGDARELVRRPRHGAELPELDLAQEADASVVVPLLYDGVVPDAELVDDLGLEERHRVTAEGRVGYRRLHVEAAVVLAHLERLTDGVGGVVLPEDLDAPPVVRERSREGAGLDDVPVRVPVTEDGSVTLDLPLAAGFELGGNGLQLHLNLDLSRL